MDQLAMTREDVDNAVRSRGGQQRTLWMPREYHGTFAMMPGINNEQRVHLKYLFTQRYPLSLDPPCVTRGEALCTQALWKMT